MLIEFLMLRVRYCVTSHQHWHVILAIDEIVRIREEDNAEVIGNRYVFGCEPIYIEVRDLGDFSISDKSILSRIWVSFAHIGKSVLIRVLKLAGPALKFIGKSLVYPYLTSRYPRRRTQQGPVRMSLFGAGGFSRPAASSQQPVNQGNYIPC